TKCGNCVSNCPVGAISINGYPKIDYKKCIHCYCCHELCPEGAYTLVKKYIKKG
ncbi:MAG: 4Fe-4S binding protein, partial [Candidatus Aenigmarchaeota archaeon]|nr:4Fe-4S binding protein [Candidatus Aenigmarchaeota archaeon]